MLPPHAVLCTRPTSERGRNAIRDDGPSEWAADQREMASQTNPTMDTSTSTSASTPTSRATPTPTPTPTETVGSLLAAIATALQDVLRILMFADKRGWGPDEFEQVRAVEEALDEAKRDFQAMAPLVNGQFYYENDRKPESLAELSSLRGYFEDHTQLFRDWIRSGGPINPLWVRETVHLRRQLHRAQCRAARRIFNAEHEAGDGSGSGARCLGAFLVYRRFREQEDLRKQQVRDQAYQKQDGSSGQNGSQSQTIPSTPAWKQQLPQLRARERRMFAGQERFRGRTAYNDTHDDEGDSLEMTPQPRHAPPPPQNASANPASARPLLKSAMKASTRAPSIPAAIPAPAPMSTSATTPLPTPSTFTGSFEPAQTTIPLHPDEPPSPPPKPPTLEELVPYCNAVGTFERFGDRDIAFICDFCDGHIVWEDVQRLPTTRLPPAAISSSSTPATFPPFTAPKTTASAQATPLPTFRRPSAQLSSIPQPASSAVSAVLAAPDGEGGEDDYPRWQATTVAVSDTSTQRTVVFAPLAIANHLPPMTGDWEARLWCPYCDEYLYFDSAEGDQTKYAQDEHGFPSLTDFQLHLEWHHTALPMPALSMPALPAASNNCVLM
ncbi:uncharacterized protein SPSK_02339 [Sporothrix schenckii 1099-18]|nr:uncharacterized protein SPSK_02339 [Sporothrix schenckii 1099-18]KJR86737.1 hypothetical protein SPSK_02339 [Sporothrix schenckii 1099-18]